MPIRFFFGVLPQKGRNQGLTIEQRARNARESHYVTNKILKEIVCL